MSENTKALSRPNAEIANALVLASAATLLLNLDGVTVTAALANGRRPVLVVTHLPRGINSVVKRHYPNGMGGTTVVRAAHYEGCQLEYMYDVPGIAAGAPLRADRPVLEVVRG